MTVDSATIAAFGAVLSVLCGAIGVQYYALREANKRAETRHDEEIKRMREDADKNRATLERVEAALSGYNITNSQRNEVQRDMARAIERLDNTIERSRSGSTWKATRPGERP